MKTFAHAAATDCGQIGRTRLPLLNWLGGLALMALSAVCLAQGYPSKTMRLVVPFPPAGPTDITGRLIAQKFSESSGQTVIVDNRVGGATIIGTEFVVKSAPDGHTMLLMPVQVAINPSMFAKLPYDTLTDLTGVTQLTNQPYILIAHPSVPFRTVQELIAAAKANPGSVRCGSSGVGGGNHLACEMFNKMAGTQITHVPYKGAAPAMNDTIGGQVEIYMPNPIMAMQHVKSGRVRAIAITGSKRISLLPDLPTIAEGGIVGYDAGVWMGLFVPSATPRDLVRRIHQETLKILQLPDVRKNLTAEGGEIVGSTPEQFAQFMKAEVQKWGEIVKFSGAKAE